MIRTPEELVDALRRPIVGTSSPHAKRREVYEAQSGGYYITYSAYGGTGDQVSKWAIGEAALRGLIRPSFPQAPECACWRLTDASELVRNGEG